MNNLALEYLEPTKLEIKTLTLYEQATSLSISDEATYVAAAELGKGLKALEKEITDYHEPLRLAARATMDAVLKRKNDDLAPVTEAMGIVRATINTYLHEQDRIKKEADRKAQIAADAVAEVERKKLLAQAEKAMDSGKDVKAEALIEKAENVYSAPVMTTPAIDKTIRTAAGNVTQAKELQITVADPKAFLVELIKINGALTMVEIKAGPLKAWIKANGIKNFPGLHIVETVGVRL